MTATLDRMTLAEPTATEFAPLALLLTLNVTHASEQEPVLITGHGFGREAGTVTFNEVPARVLTWTDGAVLTSVPYGATSGNLTVRTVEGREASVHFTVDPGVWTHGQP